MLGKYNFSNLKTRDNRIKYNLLATTRQVKFKSVVLCVHIYTISDKENDNLSGILIHAMKMKINRKNLSRKRNTCKDIQIFN